MDGELWKLREDVAEQSSKRIWRRAIVWILGLVTLLICGGLGALAMRPKPVENPPETRGLKLLGTKVILPATSFTMVNILLPCSGLLSIDASVPARNRISAFVVAPEEYVKMKAKQTFEHVEGFDADSPSSHYQRSARLPPGRYSLVLMDQSSGLLPSSSLAVSVTARLTELK